MAWPLIEELSELDPATVEHEFQLKQLLRKVKAKLMEGVREFSGEIEVLEEATSPLVNYPCKLYFELLLDSLRALEAGIEPPVDPLKLVEEVEAKWPEACSM